MTSLAQCSLDDNTVVIQYNAHTEFYSVSIRQCNTFVIVQQMAVKSTFVGDNDFYACKSVTHLVAAGG